jgi:hypothetical protein
VHSNRLQKAFILVLSVGVTCAFFINFCATVFHCGCRSLWAGADAMCNIHAAGMHHCPWCQHQPVYAFAAMVVPQAFISFARRPWSWWKRLALALAAFPVFGGIAAGIYGVASGYW